MKQDEYLQAALVVLSKQIQNNTVLIILNMALTVGLLISVAMLVWAG